MSTKVWVEIWSAKRGDKEPVFLGNVKATTPYDFRRVCLSYFGYNNDFSVSKIEFKGDKLFPSKKMAQVYLDSFLPPQKNNIVEEIVKMDTREILISKKKVNATQTKRASDGDIFMVIYAKQPSIKSMYKSSRATVIEQKEPSIFMYVSTGATCSRLINIGEGNISNIINNVNDLKVSDCIQLFFDKDSNVSEVQYLERGDYNLSLTY